MQYVRDQAMTALVLGFFASCWFGWAQERPPKGWRLPLTAGAVLALAVATLGGMVAWQAWSGGSALGATDAMRRYGIILGAEFALAAAGSVVLVVRRRQAYLAPWICLVVGVHFWPLAALLDSPLLTVAGILLTGIAAAAIVVSRRTELLPSTVTGAGAGVTLLAVGAWSALLALI